MIEVAAVVASMVAPVLAVNTVGFFVWVDCFKLFHVSPEVLPAPVSGGAA